MGVAELARIQQAHHRRLLGLQEATAELVGESWDTFANLGTGPAAEFSAAAGLIVDTAKLQTATIAVGYMNANDRLGGFPDSGLVPALPEIRGGIPTTEIYERSIVEARRRVAAGADYADAMGAGRARAVQTARTDVVLANKTVIDAGGEVRPWVVGYRRVLTGKSCAFCATASTQRYTRALLLPIHPSCDCDVAEIFGTEDPGRVINQGLLNELKAAGKQDGRPDYWNGPYVVDGDGTIRYRQVETVTGADGKPLLGPNGNPLRKITAGDKVVPEVVQHGELGPLLTDAKHGSSTVADLPASARPSPSASPSARPPATAPPATAPELPQVRRSKATATSPDVLAEASRTNVSPARVVELREEKAQRRFLEDRARRDAAKALSADSPEVRAVAERYGVHPDEVLTARARVADVRAVAREQAARTQLEAIRELERFDAVQLKPPPLKSAKSGTGRTLRGGEYDFLERVSDREKARLSRKWYGGVQAPDQIAQGMSEALARDMSSDEAMQLWLDLNRRSEAAGALRRGKLPSLDAYSGQIDPADLVRELSDEGYDIAKVFGEDLDAAGHIASVEADLVKSEALDYLGAAANPVEGQAPYRMGFQSWEEEVRTLEFAIGEGSADAAGVARYGELVPQYLDEAGLDFEELYARIVSTARKAGEEVPDYARIPWE